MNPKYCKTTKYISTICYNYKQIVVLVNHKGTRSNSQSNTKEISWSIYVLTLDIIINFVNEYMS